MLSNYKQEFLSLLHMDPLFPVKFAYLLDRAFQNFVEDLGDYYNQDGPIRRARRKHRGQQIRDIEAAMSGFKTGSLSQLFLPRSLRTESTPKNTQPPTEGGPGGAKQKAGTVSNVNKEKTTNVAWWTKNPNPVAAWKLPDGKVLSDFFDVRNIEMKPNTMNWPKFQHHDPKKNRKSFLCIKYQCTGSCSGRCHMAHVDPEKMTDEEKKSVSDKFKKVYGE
jgi:hypothetical protein